MPEPLTPPGLESKTWQVGQIRTEMRIHMYIYIYVICINCTVLYIKYGQMHPISFRGQNMVLQQLVDALLK